ncbi:MAG: hypothetical protein HY275_06410 [Gemmatimonadetes bacterium]|nr:hypothetical protein [Gemmatimonadota bacterium]
MRAVWAVLLAILGLAGFGMSLCGVVVTGSALIDRGQAMYLLVFSLPALLIGLFVIRSAWARWKELQTAHLDSDDA